jgi:hypothetical protein
LGEADHQVSQAACGSPTDNPGPDQHSPLDRPTPTQGKKKKRKKNLNNKQAAEKKKERKKPIYPNKIIP